jgi:basic membrane lipoprotein Med (substrate-binding protein (PBP1-ABC) superfamily)
LSVNPDAKVKITFIESWYDPVKASEAASAQIAAGADIIFQLGETFQVCEERKIQCIGNYIDMSSQAPGHVPMSTLLKWDPQLNYFIDLILDHRANGTPYAAPDHKIQYDMIAGASDITELASYVSDEAKAAVAKARAAILSGELKVINDGSLPKSD